MMGGGRVQGGLEEEGVKLAAGGEGAEAGGGGEERGEGEAVGDGCEGTGMEMEEEMKSAVRVRGF